MDLYDYLRALRNHWLGSLVIVLAVGAAAFGVSVLQKPVYAASASGFVGTGATENPAFGSANDALAKSRATSYIDIATSRATAERVIDALDLQVSEASLVRRIRVVQPPDTVLLKITARADTPTGAREIADAWVEALAEEVKEIEAPGQEQTPDGTPRIIPVESADLPSSPVSPRPLRNTVAGLIVGLMVAFGYAMTRTLLDRRLRRAEDVTSRFRVAVVGEIPNSPAMRISPDNGRRLEDDPAPGEAVRKLRTNLMYMDVDAPPRVLVVTSPKPGDGKSTIAAHLALALATTGEKVVLIDADLRRPTQADRFGLDPAVGVTTVLTGRLPLTEALQQPARSSLSVLTAGPLPPNPSELLASQAFGSVIEELGQTSYVVIDAPPLLPVTDAAILARGADGAFVVISAGKTLETELGQSLEALEKVGARTLGVVLNKVARPLRGYGYHYYDRPATPQDQDRRGSGQRRKPSRGRG